MNVETFPVDLQTTCFQTIKTYRSDLQLFGAFLGKRSISEVAAVDQSLMNAYVEYMREIGNPNFDGTELADTLVARRLAAASYYLEFLRATTTQPRLRKPTRNRQKYNRPVEEHTLELLLRSIKNARDRLLIMLVLASGLRISELQQLNRDSITIELRGCAKGEEEVTGRGEVVGKRNNNRMFYVNGPTMMACAEYLSTRTDDQPALFLSVRKRRMSVSAIRYTLEARCNKGGFSGINFQRLRHTFAARLANAGISSMVLKELMGHSSFTTTSRRYIKLTDATVARGYFSAINKSGK
jgi:site-specific recombinase XerD